MCGTASRSSRAPRPCRANSRPPRPRRRPRRRRPRNRAIAQPSSAAFQPNHGRFLPGAASRCFVYDRRHERGFRLTARSTSAIVRHGKRAHLLNPFVVPSSPPIQPQHLPSASPPPRPLPPRHDVVRPRLLSLPTSATSAAVRVNLTGAAVDYGDVRCRFGTSAWTRATWSARRRACTAPHAGEFQRPARLLPARVAERACRRARRGDVRRRQA